MDESNIILSQIRDLMQQVDDLLETTLRSSNERVMLLDDVLAEDIESKETCILIETKRITRARGFSPKEKDACFEIVKQGVKVMQNKAYEESKMIREQYHDSTDKIKKILNNQHTAVNCFYDTSEESINKLVEAFRLTPKDLKNKLQNENDALKKRFDNVKEETKKVFNTATNKVIIMDDEMDKTIAKFKKFNKKTYDEMYAQIRFFK